MRARYPEDDGFIERDGVKVHYEVYNPEASPTVFLLPTWSIVHSRIWKSQIPFLARHYRVVTFDGRGNGQSDRPQGDDAYADAEFVADALSVMDRTQTSAAVLVGFSMGARWAYVLAGENQDRVQGVILIGSGVGSGVVGISGMLTSPRWPISW